MLACVIPIATLGFDEQTGDALKYTWAARTGVDLYHPHHLLYSAAVRGVHALLAPVAGELDMLRAAQIHNAAWALVLTVGLFSLWRALGISTAWAWGGAFVLFLTQGIWTYVFMAEMYVPALACLTLCTLALVAGAPLAVSALALALAVLYHQGNVLFVAAVAAFLVVDRGRRAIPGLASFLAISGGATLAAYAAAFGVSAHGPKDLHGFLSYCTDYASYPMPDWGTWSNVGPQGVLELLRSQLWGFGPVPPIVQIPAALLLGLILAALVVAHARAIRRGGEAAPMRALACVWLAVYFGFYLWWLPTEKHLFVATIVPIALLVGLALVDLAPRRWPQRLALGVAAASALLNLAGTIVPWHLLRDPILEEAARVDCSLPPGCVIVGRYRLVHHLRYFHGREAIVPGGLPILFRYAEIPPPEEVRIDPNACVCVSLVYLDPAYAIGPYDGFKERRTWYAYASDLFALRQEADGRLEHRRFDVRPGDANTPFVCIDPETSTSARLESFAAELDRAVDAVDPGKPGRFTRWVRAGSESSR